MRSTELRSRDDASLLQGAREGDSAAFGELVRRHEAAALRLAAVISGSSSDAPDIAQDAFVAVHARLGSYRGTGTVRSWLLRAVANHAKNHVRSGVRRRDRDDRSARLEIRTADGADRAALDRLEHARLAAALSALSRRDRAVLGCRFVSGLGESETADVLGVAVGTVKSRTSRALRRLERQLAATRDEERP